MSNRKQRDKNRFTAFNLSRLVKGQEVWFGEYKDIPREARIALALMDTTQEDVDYAKSLNPMD